MSYAEYVKHYFTLPDCIIFFVLAFVLLAVVYAVFYIYSKGRFKNPRKMQQEFFSLTERFYELIFSGGSIIGFMAAYYLINRFVTSGAFYQFWSDYKDYLLLVFMIISILVNTFFDHVLVPLKRLDRDEMASIRLTGMLYMILIFCYIKFIYEDNNYDMFITYFLTLMIGRFVYFDASFKDFLHCIKQAAANIPIMIMGLTYLGILCLYGYSTSYLLKHNGVITNIFFCHLYIVVAIFVLHFIPEIYFKKKEKERGNRPKKKKRPRPSDVDEDVELEEIDIEILDL
jgi:hypothetical protein